MIADLLHLKSSTRWRVRLWHVKNWLLHRRRELAFHAFLFFLPLLKFFLPALTVAHGKLYVRVTRGDGSIEDYGLVGRHLIVTAGKNYVASCFDNTAEPENLKFHAYGIGTTAAAAGDTTLQSEATTEYATNNTRPTGSQAHSTNTYTTIATFAPDSAGSATIAVTEWGLFDQASNAGGNLLDRQVFAAVNLVPAADTLQTTYVLTFS